MIKREQIIRWILLVIGVFCIGLGIALAKHSDLGISPISSVPNIISEKFPVLTVGTYLMLWNCLMIVAQIIILRKNFKPIQFLQFPISLLLGVFTDVGMLMVSFIPTDLYLVRLALVLAGVVIISLGITFMLISDTVMNVGEELVDVLSKVLHKSFGSVKVVFDVSCVTLSVILSLLFFDFTIVGTREGTLITALCTGFVVKWLTKHIKPQITKIIKSK